MAATRLGSEDTKELHKLIKKEKKVFKAHDQNQEYEINHAFHLRIAQSSGNQVLVRYVMELLQKTTIFLILFDPFYQLADINNTSPDEHEKIVQWLEEKNGKQAGLAMKQHLESVTVGIDVNGLIPKDYLTV